MPSLPFQTRLFNSHSTLSRRKILQKKVPERSFLSMFKSIFLKNLNQEYVQEKLCLNTASVHPVNTKLSRVLLINYLKSSPLHWAPPYCYIISKLTQFQNPGKKTN